LQGPIALLGIAGDSHGLIVATQMALSRRRALARPPNDRAKRQLQSRSDWTVRLSELLGCRSRRMLHGPN
jgi:hypothetical protein